MKCVKTANGSVLRVKEKRAAKMVENPDYSYCPKWEFKIQEGKKYRGEKLVNGIDVATKETLELAAGIEGE